MIGVFKNLMDKGKRLGVFKEPPPVAPEEELNPAHRFFSGVMSGAVRLPIEFTQLLQKAGVGVGDLASAALGKTFDAPKEWNEGLEKVGEKIKKPTIEKGFEKFTPRTTEGKAGAFVGEAAVTAPLGGAVMQEAKNLRKAKEAVKYGQRNVWATRDELGRWIPNAERELKRAKIGGEQAVERYKMSK